MFDFHRKVTFNRPLIIQAPRIGFLNLIGPGADAIMNEDREALGPLFVSMEQSRNTPPSCDVLVIYADLQSDGRIARSSDSVRDLIWKSKAKIAIVASENTVQNYIAAGKRPGRGKANLVMTLRRREARFTAFFSQIFRKMYEGQSMPIAWTELAPQTTAETQQACPETIFAAEITHVVFGRRT